jgi:hypothetical protein
MRETACASTPTLSWDFADSFLVNSLPIEAASLLFKKEIFYRERGE